MTLDIQSLVILGSITGGIIAAMQALVTIGDRLWRKRDPRTEHPTLFSATTQQSLQQQTLILQDMVKTLQSMVNDANLRHQIILDRIEMNHREVMMHIKK